MKESGGKEQRGKKEEGKGRGESEERKGKGCTP